MSAVPRLLFSREDAKYALGDISDSALDRYIRAGRLTKVMKNRFDPDEVEALAKELIQQAKNERDGNPEKRRSMDEHGADRTGPEGTDPSVRSDEGRGRSQEARGPGRPEDIGSYPRPSTVSTW